MADIIQMDYALMEEMAQGFRQGVETIEMTISDVNTIAQMISDGALLGQGGDAFAEACTGSFVPVLQRLVEKFTELEGDINAATESMRSADSEAQGLIG